MANKNVRSLILFCTVFFLSLHVFSADLPGEVGTLLKQWKSGGGSESITEALNRLVDRKEESIRKAFSEEIERVAQETGLNAVQTEQFVNDVLLGMGNYEMKLSTDLALEVAKELNVEAVIRTGSSGDRHMQWSGKNANAGRFVLGKSDDDISFLGKDGEKAAVKFNSLKASRKLGNAHCKGFALAPISDSTSFELLVKQIKNPDAFVGAAGFGGIKKEILEKGGAVIGVREGSEMLPTSELVSDFIARHKNSSLAEIMDVATIVRDLREFGPLTMYASCSRQLSHNPADRDKVKYLLRIYAAMEACGSFEEAARLGCRQTPAELRLVGKKLAEAYSDSSGKAATALLGEVELCRLQVNALEPVLLSTSHKLGEIVARAEKASGEGVREFLAHTDMQRMMRELGAGFALLKTIADSGGTVTHEDIAVNIIPSMLRSLNAEGQQKKMLYTALYDAFLTGEALNEAAAEKVVVKWISTGNPLALTRLMKDAGRDGVKERQLLLGMAEERMGGKKSGETVKNLQKLIGTEAGDSFLWRLLSSEPGVKFTAEAISMAPFVIMKMYDEYSKGQMNDLSDAAFALIEFPPFGMELKMVGCEGMNREVVFLFLKDGLYFTPAWPLVLAGDVIHMSWMLSDVIKLQNENEGIVDVLVYNGKFEEKNGKYTFKELNLPEADTVSRETLRDWLFKTKYVRVKHALEGLDYRINNMQEKSWHLFNGFYVSNDPVLQQMHMAIEQQLSGINWDEALKYFKENPTPDSALAGYLLWLAGIEYVKTSGRNEGWAKLYEKLKADLEKRKDVLQKDFMVPQLIELAETKRATLDAENGLKPKLSSLQEKLEAIRGGNSPEEKKLGITLVDEVDRRAKKEVDKSAPWIARDTRTGTDKKMTRGQYWQSAYEAYLRIYNISLDMPQNVKRTTGCDNVWILRFKWTGEYVDDLRKAEQSKKGFAAAIHKAKTDIQGIKGSLPDPLDKIDGEAFYILGSVLFPRRMALDEADQAEEPPDSPFQSEYEAAIEKVKALYAKNKDFESLLQKGSTLSVVPNPVVLNGAADIELQLKDKDLRKLFEDNLLTILWSAAPHGEIIGRKDIFRSKLNVTKPEPLVVSAEVERLGRDRARGIVKMLVQVLVPDDFITLKMDPSCPLPGGPFTVKADIPEEYYGKPSSGFEYRWSGRNCIVSGKNISTIDGKAGLEDGTGLVQLELWAAGKAGESTCLGRKSIEFNMAQNTVADLVINGETRFQEGDPIRFEAVLKNLDEKQVSQLSFEWLEKGRVSGTEPTWDAGRKSSGEYEADVRASWINSQNKKIVLTQKRKYSVESKSGYVLNVRGPSEVNLGSPAVLSAELIGKARQVEEAYLIEWASGGKSFFTGETLSLDTSTLGKYEFTVNAVSAAGSRRILASCRYTLVITGKKEDEENTKPDSIGNKGGVKLRRNPERGILHMSRQIQ